jgi:hypothetical protein
MSGEEAGGDDRERLANMTGQPAPADNPVLENPSKYSVAKLQHRRRLGTI